MAGRMLRAKKPCFAWLAGVGALLALLIPASWEPGSVQAGAESGGTPRWSALGSGVEGSIRALVVGPDGTVYVGGDFTRVDGKNVTSLAKWNGSTWSALGAGIDGSITALAVDRKGVLYAAGYFKKPNGKKEARVLKFNGETSSVLGIFGFMSGGFAECFTAMAVAPDGALYVAGDFNKVGEKNIKQFAKWNGSNWSSLGTSTLDGYLSVMAAAPDGTLYVGGDFSTRIPMTKRGTNIAYYSIGKWQGSKWSIIGPGIWQPGRTSPHAFTVGPDGSLYVGGYFNEAGGKKIKNLAKLHGSTWSALGSGLTLTGYEPASIYSLAVAPDGSLYAAGSSNQLSGKTANGKTVKSKSVVGKWNGSRWSLLDTGLETSLPSASRLAVGPNGILYAAGIDYSSGGGSYKSQVAIWK